MLTCAIVCAWTCTGVAFKDQLVLQYMTVDLDRRILFRWSLQIVDNLVAEIKEFIYLTRYMGQSTSVVGNVYNEFSDTVCSSNVFCGLCLIIVLSIIKSSKVVTLKTSVNGRELNFSE